MVECEPPGERLSQVSWHTLPEVADLLGVRLRDVRRALADRRLLAARAADGGPLRVPAEFLVAEPGSGRVAVLEPLRGTATVLADAGLDDEAAVRWLLDPYESLGTSPVDALRSGRVHEVRRAAQVLAL